MNRWNPSKTTCIKFLYMRCVGLVMIILFGYGLEIVNLRKGDWPKGNGKGMITIFRIRFVLLTP